MVKIPAWISEIITAVTSVLGIEPTRLVQSIIISVLLVGVIAGAAMLVFMLRSLLSRGKPFSNDNSTARIHAIDATIKPASAEYLRTINDAIETALFPVFRRIKRLEEKTFPTPEAQHPVIAQPHDTAARLYDEVQDVVLPQEQEEVTEANEVQGTAQHALPPAEDEEHTTVAQQESPSDQQHDN